jgi:hypothetical protein
MPHETMPLYRGGAVVIACGIIASFSWGLGLHGTTSWPLFAVYLVMAPSRGTRRAARAS